MNIKHLFFCMLLITFSSCSKPGYEKAIAEWVQDVIFPKATGMKFLRQPIPGRFHKLLT